MTVIMIVYLEGKKNANARSMARKCVHLFTRSHTLELLNLHFGFIALGGQRRRRRNKQYLFKKWIQLVVQCVEVFNSFA